MMLGDNAARVELAFALIAGHRNVRRPARVMRRSCAGNYVGLQALLMIFCVTAHRLASRVCFSRLRRLYVRRNAAYASRAFGSASAESAG